MCDDRAVRSLALLFALASCNDVFGLDPPIDAGFDGALDATVDAFEAECASDYTLTITSTTSLYKFVDLESGWASLHALCRVDGVSHLAVLDSLLERDELRVAMPAGVDYYVGAFQRVDQATPAEGWRQLTGGELPATLWAAPGQPNDMDGAEDNHSNVAAIRRDLAGLLDNPEGSGSHGAICECDFKTVVDEPAP